MALEGVQNDQTEIELMARDLCLMEGWDPDELIDCEPGDVPSARPAGDGRWTCRRWQVYAPAVERRMKQAADDWDVF